MLNNVYKKFLELHHKLLFPHKGKKSANLIYKKVFHHNVNWDSPHDLIEKIYWLQLNTDTSMWSFCADKFKMREYVTSKGYEQYLPKLYGHWYDVDSIDFNPLPDSFVLKINNGCGNVIFCEDKNKINIAEIKKQLFEWLSHPFGYIGAQYHYLRIQPCFLAEELLSNDSEKYGFSSSSIVDYKVWCINGKPESILVVFNRNKTGYCLDLYDTSWKRIDNNLKKTNNGHSRVQDQMVPKPICLEKMLEIAASLASPFPEVRVDFYQVNGLPVIGELTFSTGYGYFTYEYYSYLGSKMIIGNIGDEKLY